MSRLSLGPRDDPLGEKQLVPWPPSDEETGADSSDQLAAQVDTLSMVMSSGEGWDSRLLGPRGAPFFCNVCSQP